MNSSLVVVSGLIVRFERVLLVQRSAEREFPFEWESPGGKVEGHESDVAALRREILEELGVFATIDKAPVHVSSWSPPLVKQACEIRLYRCYIEMDAEPALREGQLGMGWFSEPEVSGMKLLPGNSILKRIGWKGLVYP